MKQYNATNDIQTGYKSFADFHTHSNFSIDGTKSIKSLIKFAQKDNTTFLGITDHNTITGINQYLDKLDYQRQDVFDNVKGKTIIVPGVEITARINHLKNLKGKPVKIHLVAYGIDRNDLSPISLLLTMKSINDKHVDLGFVTQLQNYFKFDLTDQDIREYIIYCQNQNKEFNAFGKAETIEFSKFLNLNLTDNDEQLKTIIDTFTPTDRINLEAKDVIDLVHASGGIVLLAHPQINLQRTKHSHEVIDYLIKNEIDGFEMYYPQSTRSCDTYLRKVSKENHISLFSGGSDFHHDDSHNNIHNNDVFERITTDKVQAFIDYLYELNIARKKGILVYKNYKNLKSFDPDQILEKYRLKFCNCEQIDPNTPLSEFQQ